MYKLTRLAGLTTLGLLLVPGYLLAISATLKPIKGSVYIQHPKKDLWESVKGPTSVDEGDRVKTNNASSAFLVLPDDHRVAIDADTFITLERVAEGETKIFLKTGSIRNKVRHLQLDLGQFYKVQTPSAVCAVRGTDFAVIQNVQGPMANVHVFEGMVDLSALRKDISAAVTHLEAGHSASIDAGGAVQPMASASPASPSMESSANSPAPEKKDDKGKGPDSHGPPPPGSGPTGGTPVIPPPGATPPAGGPNWYDHPDSISPDTFKPTSGLPSTYNGMNGPGPTTNRPPDPSSFNPIAGTGFGPTNPTGNPTNPTGTGSGPGNIYNLPPNGDTPPTSGSVNPTATGNQALFDTITSLNLMNKLQGLQVADLYKDGSVRMGPDGQFHQYADAIQSMGTDGVRFLNATMNAGHPESLNYQIASIKFNQNLPITEAFQVATQTAFRGDIGTTPPAYYATDFENYRSNTVDYLQVLGHNGFTTYDPTTNRHVTKFPDGQCTVNGINLWTTNAGVMTYLGGAHPTLQPSSGSGKADSALNNVYAGGVTLGRRVTYYDPVNNQIVSPGSVPTTVTAQQYLSGPDVMVQDTLFSNLFTHGPIVTFGTARSRLFSGIDSILTP